MKETKSLNDRVNNYRSEFDRWLNVLSKYHTERFERNYEQYTSDSRVRGTQSKISDPVAPEQIERVIQKMFEREPKFILYARKDSIPKEITNIMSGILEYYWNCPERVMTSGTMRNKLKMWAREFCIVGNLVTETYYNAKSDTSDARALPIEDTIFDPAATLKTSDVYYVRQNVSMKYLEDNVIKEVDGVKKGIFDAEAVKKIKVLHQDGTFKQDDRTNRINRSGSKSYEEITDDVLLVSRWEGSKVCRIADWYEIVQEVDDPMGIQDHPLQFAMDIEVVREPYAFSLLDHISGLTHGKDLLLNQIVDYGSKALNPPMFVDPSLAPINRATLRNAYKVGGIVYASPQQVEHKPMPPLPQEGFALLNYLQTRAEQASGIGAYLGGVPNQTSDKTQGTKGGIDTLVSQAMSPVRDRQINIEESIIEPMVNKWLKMAGNLMSENEIKYALITGSSTKMIKVTKGLLTGKITLQDLLTAELIDTEKAVEITQELIEQGKDPRTELLYDIDWVVRVETGSMAEVDSEKEQSVFDSLVQAGMGMGLQIDAKKVWIEKAIKSGIKEPEQYLIEQPEGMGQPLPPMPAMNPQM